MHVAAGYARNYLIPQRKALYATRQNFIKLGMTDPDLETIEERQARLAQERLDGEDKDLKAADLLKHYLRNKVVSWIIIHTCCVLLLANPFHCCCRSWLTPATLSVNFFFF